MVIVCRSLMCSKFLKLPEKDMSITQLPASTVKLITCSQIITSVSSVVKELMENSLDAGASCLDVKLMNTGLDRIEVKDNGSGINKVDTPHMALPHYTSKITEFSDLDKVNTYGFRGEALNAICQVAQVTITTATSSDPIAMTYTLDSCGNVTGCKPSHHAQGTTVTATNLFKNMPVRRQYIGSGRRLQEELKQVESLVKALAVIKPKCRVTMTHNKCLIWQKTPCSTLQSSFSQLVGYSTSQLMESLSLVTSNKIAVDMLIPKRNCDVEGLCKSTPNTSLVFINERVVTYKKLIKALHQQLNSHYGDKFPSRKYAICLISILISPGDLDVNLNPSKTEVLLKDEDTFLSTIEKSLEEYYNATSNVGSLNTAELEANISVNSEDAEIEGAPSFKRRKLDIDSKPSEDLKKQANFSPRKHNSANEGAEPLNSNFDEVISSCASEKRNHKITCIGQIDGESCELNSRQQLILQENEYLHEDTFQRNTKSGFSEMFPSRPNENQTFTLKETGFVEEKELASVITSCLTEEGNPEVDSNLKITLESQNSAPREHSPDLFTDSSQVVAPDLPESCDLIHSKTGHTVGQVDLQAWSMGRLQGAGGGLIQGACVLVPGAEAESKDKSLPTDQIQTEQGVNGMCMNELDDLQTPTVNPPASQSAGFPHFQSSSPQKTPPRTSKLCSPKRKVRRSPRKSEVIDGVPLDNTLMSVSSQMGRRELAAFTKYAREARPQIILQNPGISFTKVAALLAEQWHNLSSEEKEHYEEIARQSATNRKVWQTADKQRVLNWLTVHPKDSEDKNKTIGNSLKGNSRKEVVCELTMKLIQERCFNVDSLNATRNIEPLKANGVTLIGQLEPSGSWICKDGPEIFLLSHYRLQEVVVYHRLLETFTIPLKALPVKEDINRGVLGEKAWCILKSLECSFDMSKRVITADVISKNGFRIEISEGEEKALLTHVAETINFYGIRELKEVLELVKLTTPTKLSSCRPLRVINHIKGEAMRICRKSPSVLERAMVEELLLYWKTTMCGGNGNCLHFEPILTPIFNLAACQQKDSSEIL